VAAGLEGPGWLVPFLPWEVGTFAVAKLPGFRWRVRPAKMLKKKVVDGRSKTRVYLHHHGFVRAKGVGQIVTNHDSNLFGTPIYRCNTYLR